MSNFLPRSLSYRSPALATASYVGQWAADGVTAILVGIYKIVAIDAVNNMLTLLNDPASPSPSSQNEGRGIGF